MMKMTMTLSLSLSALRAHARLLGATLAGALILLTTVAPVAAQTAPAPKPARSALTDSIELVSLVTRQPSADGPTNVMQFEAVVNYRLQSVESGTVLLFLFENDEASSTQESSNAINVQRGTGQIKLNIDYTIRPDVRTLSLVTGLFKGEQKLLAWVSTNPIDVEPWPGRVAFERAMGARLSNDFPQADQDLTAAIQESPGTGNYYYWRADTRVRLDRYDEAITDFNRAIDLMPQDRASRVGRGIALLWQGDLQPAVEDLTVAIDASPQPDKVTAWAYRARGVARSQLGLTSGAVADYQSYLALSPTAADRAQVESWIAALS